MKKSTIITIILIIAAGLIGYGLGMEKQKKGAEGENKEPVKIGVIVPLTGDLASVGIEGQKVLEMAIAEINVAGEINNRNLSAIYEDSQCNAKTATIAAQKLINIDKVKIILGDVCSGSTLAVATITEKNQTILLSPWASSPLITTAGDYVFRISTSDALAGAKTAELAYKKLGYHKGAIIAESTDYSLALKDAFVTNFTKNGGQIVANENYNTGDTDMKTQILKVKNSDAEFLFLIPQTPIAGSLLVKQVIENGVTMQLIGNEFPGYKEVVDAVGSALEGIFYYVPTSPLNNSKTQKFYNDYKNKYGEEISITQYTPNVYDAIQIIAIGLQKYGEDTTKIRDYLYSIKNYEGVSGLFSFDENGDVDKDYTLMIFKNGKSEVIQ